MSDKHRVGLFGFGCVGKGFYDLQVQHPQLNIKTKRIVVKDRGKKREISNGAVISFDDFDILKDSEIKLLVEAINHNEDALVIARSALSDGKTLISTNKKMLAENLAELIALQQQYGGRLFYEASSAGAIPIIGILEKYFSNEKIFSLEAILNGTSNFILTSILRDFSSFDAALKEAQKNGFAETDPTLDIGGYDAANKLVILVAHAFGTIIHPKDIFTYGIERIHRADVGYALKREWKIKQVAKAFRNSTGKLSLFVAPVFVKASHQLANVENENNGVVVDAEFAGTQFYFGKGAGSHPTGSAVLADVVASLDDYSYSYTKLRNHNAPEYSTDTLVSVYLRYPHSFNPAVLEFAAIEDTTHGLTNDVISGTISISELISKKNLLEQHGVSLIIY